MSKAVQPQVRCYLVQYPIGAFPSMCDKENTVGRTVDCNSRNCGSNTRENTSPFQQWSYTNLLWKIWVL